MSKKMKRVAFDSSPQVSYEDARARFKHQTLLQDFLELEQETEAARNKLMDLRQKKLTLQAEVRFLRRRYEFLLKNKSSTPQEQVFVNPQPTRFRKSKKEKVQFEKQATLRKLPPIQKKKAPRSKPAAPVFDLNLENAFHGVKAQSVHRAIRASNLNQRVRINGPKASPFLDLNQKDGTLRVEEPIVQTRAPVIDLNQISREAEELQEGCEPFDPQTQGLIRNGVDGQHADVKLLKCRNVGGGSGSTSRPGRKISWQDPVALRV